VGKAVRPQSADLGSDAAPLTSAREPTSADGAEGAPGGAGGHGAAGASDANGRRIVRVPWHASLAPLEQGGHAVDLLEGGTQFFPAL